MLSAFVRIAKPAALLTFACTVHITNVQAAESFDPATYPADSPLPTREGLTGTLDNGVRYAIERNAAHENENRAHVRVTIDVGSFYEETGQSGIAHLLEHVSFRGSERYSTEQVRDFMQKMGGVGEFSHQNGATTTMSTTYLMNIPEEPAANVPQAIDILAARIASPRLEPADVAAEIAIVLEEERSRRLSEAALEHHTLMYGTDHPWVTHMPIGERDQVSAMTSDVLRRFHLRWYRPERIQVVIVGDIEPEQVLDQIRDSFGEQAATQEATAVKSVPLPEGYAAAIVEDKNLPFISVLVNVSGPSEPVMSIADMRKSMARGFAASILSDRIRDYARNSLDVAGANYRARNDGYIRFDGFAVSAAKGSEIAAFEGVMRVVNKVLTEGFTAAEVDMAKAISARRMIEALKGLDRIPSAALASSWSGAGLRGLQPLDPTHRIATRRYLMAGLSINDIEHALAMRLVGGRKVLVIRVQKSDRAGIELKPFESAFAKMLTNADQRSSTNEEDPP